MAVAGYWEMQLYKRKSLGLSYSSHQSLTLQWHLDQNRGLFALQLCLVSGSTYGLAYPGNTRFIARECYPGASRRILE